MAKSSLWYDNSLGCYVEKTLEDVQALANRLLESGGVTSLNSLFREFVDGDGHVAIHFAASRNHIDTAQWILEQDPGCVYSLVIISIRLTSWIIMVIPHYLIHVLVSSMK